MKKLLVFTAIFCFILGSGCIDKNEKILNRDPNGTSELQLTMRDMYDYFDQVKIDLAAGKSIDDIKPFEHILTDQPTDEGKNTTEIYQAMASTYFESVKHMNKSKSKEAFDGVVNACMACHQQVCPGPMVKIEKLYTGI